jgi:hypothetical protein
VPADAVEDYCHSRQVRWREGYSLEIVRIAWAEIGWRRAVKQFARTSGSPRPMGFGAIYGADVVRHGFTIVSLSDPFSETFRNESHDCGNTVLPQLEMERAFFR